MIRGNQHTETVNRKFEWDAADRMRSFYTEASGSITKYAQYLYDASGNRVKKLTWVQSGDYDSNTYIDGIFEYRTDGTDKQNTLHVMDDKSRIASIRIGADFGDTTPAIKYNIEDHLGSSTIQLRDDGADINKEEYYPFGETSFGSYAMKRYKYCGKERDDESGLYYYGARYYNAWCCRFCSVDALANSYPQNTPYNYAANNPIVFIDVNGNSPGGGSRSIDNPESSVRYHGTFKQNLTNPPELNKEALEDAGISANAIGFEWTNIGVAEVIGSFNGPRTGWAVSYKGERIGTIQVDKTGVGLLADTKKGLLTQIISIGWKGKEMQQTYQQAMDAAAAASLVQYQALSPTNAYLATPTVPKAVPEAAKGVGNVIPDGKLANHIFSGKAGKLLDNPTNRSLITDLTNNSKNLLGVDKYGKSWYARTLDDGTQLYGYTQGGVVKGAGINQTQLNIIKNQGLK